MTTERQATRRTLISARGRTRTLRANLVQLMYVAGGIGLGLLVPKLDFGAAIPSIEAAALLAGATAGLLAMIGIVFALLFLVVEFAATAQSPRLHLFRDNPLVWHALGLVIGVIVYATTCVVVAANDTTTTVLVPISVLLGVLIAVGLIRQLQFEALRSVQLSATLQQVTTRTRAVIDRLYTTPFSPSTPATPTAPENPLQIRWRQAQGYLRQIDLPQLIRSARQSDSVIRLCIVPGDLVRENAVVLEIWNPRTVLDQAAVLKCLEVGIDRNLTQDPLFGFRLLNDIALRAMSASINDPATAVQAIDSIESLLSTLVLRDFEVGVIADDTDTPRVIFDSHDWEVFLGAGADEIAQTPMHPMIRRRLLAMLSLVLSIAPAERRSGIAQRITAVGGDET